MQQVYSEELIKKELEQLNADVQKLNETKIRIEHEMELAQREYEELSSYFLQEFGTSDIAQIEARIQAIQEENIKKVKEYKEGVLVFKQSIEQAQAELRKAKGL